MSKNLNNPFRNKSGHSGIHHEDESNNKRFNAGISYSAKFSRGGKRARGCGNGRMTDYAKKEKEWGKIKFNPVAPSAKEEPATPWKKFKNDILQNGAAVSSNSFQEAESSFAKEIRVKSEENYRRAQMIEKRKEPTQWETFEHNEKDVKKESTKYHNHKAKKKKKFPTNDKNSLSTKNGAESFDSKNLTFRQRNDLRRIITKTTIMAKDETLDHVVKNLKNEKKREKHTRKRLVEE